MFVATMWLETIDERVRAPRIDLAGYGAGLTPN
jgi:hypothetical protein